MNGEYIREPHALTLTIKLRDSLPKQLPPSIWGGGVEFEGPTPLTRMSSAVLVRPHRQMHWGSTMVINKLAVLRARLHSWRAKGPS